MDSLSRRQLILLGISTGAAAGGAAAVAAAAALRTESGAAGDPITHGPLLGNVSTQSIRIWIRTRMPMRWRVRYARQADFLGALTVSGETRWMDDCAGWVEIANLQPGTAYFYQLQTMVGDATVKDDSVVHRFNTLPNAAADLRVL